MDYGTAAEPTLYNWQKSGVVLTVTILWNQKTNCADANKKLEILKWEQKRIDLSGVHVVNLNNTEINRTLPEVVLQYPMTDMSFGYHLITLKTKLHEVDKDYTAHIRVIRQPLYVYIVGDKYRSVPYNVIEKKGDEFVKVNNIFTLDASKSKDPNLEDQSGLKFSWTCRKVPPINGSLPKDATKWCESEQFETLEKGDSKSLLNMTTERFLIGSSYEFNVTVKSMENSLSYVQKIEMVRGNPPEILLKFVLSSCRFASCRFASCRFVSFRFATCRFARCRFANFCFASYRFANCRFASFRFDTWRFASCEYHPLAHKALF